jgi:enediyne biosynthesis protein E4
LSPRRHAVALAIGFWICVLGGCGRQPSERTDAGFREGAAESGLRFHHFTGATGQFYLPEIMGSGVALFDYDGDGDLDVFLIQGTTLEPGRTAADSRFPPPAGFQPGNRLFRNMLKETGKLQFVDVTEQAGLKHGAYGMGVAVGDYDNDGHPDLYVTNFGGNVLYRNNGNGTFTDVTREAGVETGGWSASAAFVDYDKDGLLDLYVTRYLDFTIAGNKECFNPAGERDYCTPNAYKPVLHRLFRNLGNGKFQDVTQAAGIAAATGPGLGVVSADFDGDGWPDIYVANDGAANLLWLNNRNGTFREAALLSGCAYTADGVARAGMGVAAEDFDGSGNESIFVTNLSREGAALYRNHGHAQFTDSTLEFRLHQPTYPYTGFGAGWFDYDNDGRPDLFVANGAVVGMETLRGTAYPYSQRNLLLHNEGNAFRETSGQAGPAFQLAEVGRGVAFGDIDNDGRVDVVIANNNGPVRLLLNQMAPHDHWLEVLLQGVTCNRDGIGARVGASVKGQNPLWRRVHTDGSYLSASDVRVHFGLGQSTKAEILVDWPDGSKERWSGIQADSVVTLRQGTGHRR